MNVFFKVYGLLSSFFLLAFTASDNAEKNLYTFAFSDIRKRTGGVLSQGSMELSLRKEGILFGNFKI
jgi:hypothetical protein